VLHPLDFVGKFVSSVEDELDVFRYGFATDLEVLTSLMSDELTEQRVCDSL